jgi:hypothetical protein
VISLRCIGQHRHGNAGVRVLSGGSKEAAAKDLGLKKLP